jgi:hypothetical protein
MCQNFKTSSGCIIGLRFHVGFMKWATAKYGTDRWGSPETVELSTCTGGILTNINPIQRFHSTQAVARHPKPV